MKKLIISDFDDTIYVNKKINENVIESIKNFRKNGNLFVIATGSSYTSFKEKINGYDLEYDYLIVNHGSTIFKNDIIVENKIIDKNTLKKIIERYGLNNKNNYQEIIKSYFFSSSKEGLVEFDEPEITKVNIRFNNKETYEKELIYISENYQDKLNCYALLYNNDIELISNKASKLIAIKAIIKLENIDKNNVFTIGDGNSDIEMIKAYNGYSVNNAIDKVKKVSKESFDSVATFIKKIS